MQADFAHYTRNKELGEEQGALPARKPNKLPSRGQARYDTLPKPITGDGSHFPAVSLLINLIEVFPRSRTGVEAEPQAASDM